MLSVARLYKKQTDADPPVRIVVSSFYKINEPKSEIALGDIILITSFLELPFPFLPLHNIA